MSRNPYLAASRPSSSYTRSSRTSKRNDLSLSKGSSLLGRSRSSACLGGLANSSSSYSSATSYIPSTSSWQRSSSNSRLTRQGSDLTTKTQPISSSNHRTTTTDYTPSRGLYKSTSSHNIDYSKNNDDDDHDDDPQPTNHLQNYQQTKLEQQETGRLPSRSPVDLGRGDGIRGSTISLDSSGTGLSYDESDSIKSGSAPKHLRQGVNLMKTQSLDAGQQALDTSSLLSGTMSVDRLLLRSETMTDRELRKSYKELVVENEKLKRHLKGLDDREKQRQQDWIRKERQLERKISELEEENKQLEQWRIESQRLKDENSSLIRVLSKISKKQN